MAREQLMVLMVLLGLVWWVQADSWLAEQNGRTLGQRQRHSQRQQLEDVYQPKKQRARPNVKPQLAADIRQKKRPSKAGNKYPTILQKNQKEQQQQQQKPLGNDDTKYKYVTLQIPQLGRVRGRIVKTKWSGKNVAQFLDIPYAESPVGALRFKPSMPVKPWEDVMAAFKPHPGCPSIQDYTRFDRLLQKNVDIEDCLRLTINVKKFDGNAPVMVYIHGDFLYDGSSLEASPGYLLEEDIILVAVRYRLGPFGFLSTMSDDIPGNAAVSDIILALQWIQEHIAAFGGDPKRVTLFGQVGGSALINVLTMSPLVPEGLFHHIIYQSGSALSPAFITDSPLAAARDIARHAGCKQVNKIEPLNRCMRRMNATAIMRAFNAHGETKGSMGVGAYGGMQLVIGGPSGILPDHPGKLLTAKQYRAYPTIGGSVKNGGTFILKDIYLENFNETIIDDKLDGIGYIEHIIEHTNGADPTNAWKTYAQEEIFKAADIKNGSFYKLAPGLMDLCSTIAFKNPVLLAMQANAKKLPNQTFLYTFDYESDMNRYSSTDDEIIGMPFDLGVSLTDDNLYLFPWPRYYTLSANRDIKMARRMVALWTSFAATGVPKADGIPAWPPMTDETGPYLKLDKLVTIGDNYLDEYSAAVKDVERGYSLVNEEFFDNLVEIKNDIENNDEANDENDDENENAEDGDGDGDESEEASKGRGQHVVIIAKKSQRKVRMLANELNAKNN